MPNATVLVVDDDRTVCEYLSNFLMARGYVVDAAASGEEAIARLRGGRRRSLIILDILLPGIKSYMILQDVGLVIDLLNEASPQTERLPRTFKLQAYSTLAAVQAEKEIVARVLEETGWNRKEASRRLHVSYRALRGKRKKWRMEKRDKSAQKAPPCTGADFNRILTDFNRKLVA